MHNILVPNGATSGPGGTTVVESVSVVTIANSLTSGDLGKPVALANGAQTVSVWDDTSTSVTPIGIVCARDAASITIATTGDVINIPSTLIDSITSGAPTAGRYYFWDLSAVKYVATAPTDVVSQVEMFLWLADNGDGTHRVELLGMRPFDPSQAGGVSTKTGNYTFALADRGSLVEYNSGSAGTFTVPPNSSVAFVIGDTITVAQEGAGQLTIAAGAGVTLKSAGTRVKTSAQYAMATLVKVATDVWRLEGNLVA